MTKIKHIDKSAFPHIAFVKVRFPGNTKLAFASATLISPRVLLTAGHVVFSAKKRRFANFVEVVLGTKSGGRIRREATALRTTEQWSDGVVSPSRYDYGVIVLGQPVDLAVTHIQIETTPKDFLRTSELNVHGFPDTDVGEMYGASSKAEWVDESFIEYAIDTKPGMSGGPVFTNEGNPDSPIPMLRGVHVFGNGFGKAVRITDPVLRVVEKWKTEFRPN